MKAALNINDIAFWGEPKSNISKATIESATSAKEESPTTQIVGDSSLFDKLKIKLAITNE